MRLIATTAYSIMSKQIQLSEIACELCLKKQWKLVGI